MKYISHRIGDLELRRAENIKTNNHYLEIVEWMKDERQKDYCYTIAIFEEGRESYHINSVADRIVLDDDKWKDLGILIRLGFQFLDELPKRNGAL